RSVHHRVELPDSWKSFELALAAVVELEAGTGNEIGDRARHEDLPSAGASGDTLSDMHREPSDVGAPELDLARVKASAHLDRRCPRDRRRAPDGAGGAVEHGEHPVARRLDDAPAEAAHLSVGEAVVLIEHGPPP